MNDELNPKQADFLNHYLDKSSPTYANALQSAIKAGFSEEYAKKITVLAPKWLSESIQNYAARFDDELLFKKHLKLLNKTEKIFIKGRTGKMERFDTEEPDTQAVGKALDMAYKIKRYVSSDGEKGEKHLHLHKHENSNELTDVQRKLIEEYENKLKELKTK